MSDRASDVETETHLTEDEQSADLVLEFELEARPEKVWRAITIPALREEWLPGKDLAETEPLSEIPGEKITYRMKDCIPPFLESVVAFHLISEKNGGTLLRIVHRLTDIRLVPPIDEAANSNEPCLMLAA